MPGRRRGLRPRLRLRLAAAGFADAASALLTYAFAANPNGVVLTSSYAPGHLAKNAAAASASPAATAIQRLEALF